MRKHHKRYGSLAVSALAALGAVTGLSAANAGTLQPAVVSALPASFTPNLAADATIGHPAAYALEQSPDATTMYVGGQFDAVQNSARSVTLSRKNFVAFSATTGTISSAVAPAFNGNVWAVRASGTALYVAGEFTTVTGPDGVAVTRRGLAKLDATTGAVDPSFKTPWRSGKAYDLQVVGGRVIVGGTFAGALLALDPETGADTGYLALGVSGSCVNNADCGTAGSPATSEPTYVYRFAISSDGTHLVAIGNFVAPHPRAFMVDLGPAATLDPWYYQPLANSCILPQTYPAYLRDVDFAPDGSYFVIAATGYVPQSGGVGRDICDAAARFDTAALAPYNPSWINYTGGDTLHSVVVTGAAVYVNGHNRWLDNPDGRDSCVTTCVARPGIGAIDPVTGRALAWNPGKTRGVGGKDLLATSRGLWVASDGQKIAGLYHYGIALMPLP